MREPGVPDCTRRYFEHKIQYIPADLPASAAIVGEMQWLMKLDETPQPRRGHHASILLITENPVMQAAFDNFRKNVPQKFTPG
jgi:hypothetical protein